MAIRGFPPSAPKCVRKSGAVRTGETGADRDTAPPASNQSPPLCITAKMLALSELVSANLHQICGIGTGKRHDALSGAPRIVLNELPTCTRVENDATRREKNTLNARVSAFKPCYRRFGTRRRYVYSSLAMHWCSHVLRDGARTAVPRTPWIRVSFAFPEETAKYVVGHHFWAAHGRGKNRRLHVKGVCPELCLLSVRSGIRSNVLTGAS